MRIGIDLGGTKIEAVALAADGGEILRRRVPTPTGDYAGTLRAVIGLVAAIEDRLGARASVGIGIPGAISPATGLVKNANSTWLIGHPLDRDLARLLGRPVRVANDADCFAVSEASDGAGAGARSVFGVILGTGVGGGIVIGGRLVTGPNAIAGEWGHNPLPWPGDDERPGPPCYCGRRGCIETFLSGPGLAADFAAASGRSLGPAGIAAAAEAGDAHAEAALARYEQRLARALATVINLLDPEVIVLGGGMSNLARLYASVPRLWRRFVFSDHVATRLLPARHGDSSGVRGAAWLWPATPDPGPRSRPSAATARPASPAASGKGRRAPPRRRRR
ncbi:MAG: ROK family protein [Proteobacteria bacterium]|nr:ROK family protein [Pseudomonadota bacterium]